MSLRCYVESLGGAASNSDSARLVRLDDNESRHARLSRRLAVGDALVLFDGRGRQASGMIAEATKSVVEVSIGAIVERPRPTPAVTLAVAMPKGPRQDVLIEKCTELGVAAIQPLLTERSVSGVSDHKRDKWHRATIEAAKQSAQCWLPELLPPVRLDEYLRHLPSFDLVMAAMLPHDGKATGMIELLGQIQNLRTCLAFVGPEGGWSPDEADALIAAGAVPVSLGPNTLRIETAAISLAAMVHACAGA